MTNEKYMNMLSVFNNAYDNDQKLIIEWKNGLKVIGYSSSGVYETDMESEEENFCGEYAAAISEVEIISPAVDDSVQIYQNTIEISLKCIPEKISLQDGTVVWENSLN